MTELKSPGGTDDRRQNNKGIVSGIPCYLDQAEVEMLLNYAIPYPEGYLAIMLMWRAGLRVAEVVALRRDNLELGPTPTLRFFGKGRKERLVPVHEELQEALATFVRIKPVAATGRFIPVIRQTVNTWIKKTVAAAEEGEGRPVRIHGDELNVHPHTFRHSFARHMLNNGVRENKLQVWLGHSNLTTTHRYSILAPDPEDLMSDIP